jgi:hypothetical protein
MSEIDPLGLSGWDSLAMADLNKVCQQAGSAITYHHERGYKSDT